MLNWLKNIAFSSRTTAPISGEQIEMLRTDLARLDGLRTGLARRLVEFILSGENEEVLSEVAAVPGASRALGMKVAGGWQSPLPGRSARKDFFERLDVNDVPFLLRLAFAFDAISRSENRNLVLAGLPPEAAWLEVFLWEVTQFQRNCWPPKAGVHPKITAETLEAMLQANGQPTDLLVRAALWVDPTTYGYSQGNGLLLVIPGIAGSFQRQPNTIRESLQQNDYRSRVHALEILAKAKAPLEPVLGDLVQAAVASAKQVQEAATPLLFRHLPACLEPVKQVAAHGDNDERLRAVRLLLKLSPEESRPFLEKRLAEEKSKKIVACITEFLVPTTKDSEANEGEEGEIGPGLDLPPPLPDLEKYAPLPKDFSSTLKSVFEKANQATQAGWERIKNEKWAKNNDPFTHPSVQQVVSFLETGEGHSLLKAVSLPYWAGVDAHKALEEITARPGCGLLHAVRWCLLLKGKYTKDRFWLHQCQPVLSAFARHRKSPIDLRELSVTFRACGVPEEAIGASFLAQNRYWSNALYKLPPEKIWPYFAEHQGILEFALGMRSAEGVCDQELQRDFWQKDRWLNALSVLSSFPVPPPQFLPLLWELALGPGKQERIAAQAALDNLPGSEARIIAALGNGQQEVRANAARWIQRLKLRSSIPALETALKKEKSEVVKGAIFDALEATGVDLEPYLDRKKLCDEAEKGVGKGMPRDLEWFPFEQIPSMHWADSGKAIPANVIKWFLIQSFKLKEPTPTPLLKRYAAFFHPQERVLLGKFVLQAWITQDTLPAYTHEEAAAKAEAATKQMASYIQNNPKFAQYYQDWTEQKHYRALLNANLNTCKGSAISSKGILAVAAACCDPGGVPMVQAYLKKWYGMRHAQGKALVQMLSAMDYPAAIQLLLSVGNRFRTKGIQEEAAHACELLAERKGWSLDELADRTIPTAGFNENGVLELPYGAREFSAELGPDFEIVLRNGDGKEISSLPEPNKADDEALAKESKQRLSAARKELKGILKLQQERLYEAMCTQRTWSFADWDTFLNRHTIVGTYAQRLVWGVVEKGAVARLFRPLPDGSLTDAEDNAVTLPADAIIRLAHEATLTPEQSAAWAAHLSDYNVVPLFAQFGRPKFQLTTSQKEEYLIKDFEGYLIEAFKLRSRLTKQGYSRGAAMDGGWWATYHKRFLGLGLQAIIEFSGSPMPEENRTVALISLSFSRLSENDQTENIPLGEIPLVMLSECWNDLRTAALEGTGFDADWQKKAAY